MKAARTGAYGRAPFRLVTIGLLLLGLTVLTGEMLVRLFGPSIWPPVKLILSMEQHNCVRPQTGSEIVFYPDGMTGPSVTHRISEFGVGGDAEPGERSDLTIALVGGELLFGTGLAERASLAASLKRLMERANPGKAISVFAVGYSGFNLEEQTREFQRFAKFYQPHITILIVDLESQSVPLCSSAELPVRLYLSRVSALARFLENKVGRSIFFAPERSFYSAQFTGTGLKTLLGHFVDAAPESINILFAVDSIRIQDRTFDEPAAFDQLCQDAGFTVVRPKRADLRESMRMPAPADVPGSVSGQATEILSEELFSLVQSIVAARSGEMVSESF